MSLLNKIKKVYDILNIADGFYYKNRMFFMWAVLFIKRNLGMKPGFKQEHYVSIKTSGVVLPFFIKDQLDFDVLLDSMLEDQYCLPEIETEDSKNDINVIFDLGTNIGTAAIKFYQKFPKATIYCFEPDPYNLKRLKKNISLLEHPERIKLYNYAVSDLDEGNISFYRGSTNHWSSSLLKRDCTDEEVIVKTITLDKFCSDNKINNIDIVKMDIEGAESGALDGFKDGLNDVSYVIGELHPTLMSDSISEFIERFDSFDLEYLDTKSGVFKFKNLNLK